MSDRVPVDGEHPDGPIDTFTLWLDHPEGEAAVSLDLTGFNANMRRLNEQIDLRRQRRSRATGKETR